METRDLYGLPLDRFVAERGALAKALRADGRREEAATVSKLRRPSVAAWAVNQLIRTQPKGVNELFEAGDALQQTQSELLAGRGDAQAMRKAGERERAAVDELTGVARGLLSSQGHELTQTTLDRVSDTLHAAAFDAEARAQVSDGCLEKELRHVGLGGFGGFTPAAPATPAKPPKPAKRAAGRSRKGGRTAAGTEDESAAREIAARERAEQEHAAREEAARKAETEARLHRERTADELAAAEQRRDQAADALEEAEADLAAARERADQAELAHRRAQEALERL